MPSMPTADATLGWEPYTSGWTAADLVDRFGPIPLCRVVLDPPPGTATEDDAVQLAEHHDRLVELVGGTLLEKAMGYYEAYLAIRLGSILINFVEPRKLGIVVGSDAMTRLTPGLVRIPDVSFVALDRLPGGRVPRDAISPVVPDLAVEVISRGNTREEMRQKLIDYFTAGARLVWYIYPEPREVHVFTGAEQSRVIKPSETLDGGDVLPGFTLSLAELFTSPL